MTHPTHSLCPSSQPDQPDSKVFGIVAGTVDAPRMAHLAHPQPVTEELLALSGPVKPTEVFRFAATCMEKGCEHFDGKDCQLVTHIVEGLPTVAESLPPCPIRVNCRWWQQEGKSACLRCPQIVTENFNPSEMMMDATVPERYRQNDLIQSSSVA